MRMRPLGKTGLSIGVIGYGAMPLSLRRRPEESEAHRVLAGVLAAGVNFIDTADTYCLGPDDLHHNERLVARCVADPESPRSPVVVATKGGMSRAGERWEVDGNPERLYRQICGSYEALGGRIPIPIWQLHWPDPRYTIRQMLEPVQRAVDEQLVKYVGVCNFSPSQLLQALDVVHLVSVQNQFNLWHREAETEGVIEFCEQHDLIFLPWRPLGGIGLAELLERIPPVADLARERNISPQRLMIAWHLAKSPSVVPIPGARSLEHIQDCLAAEDERLDEVALKKLDALAQADLPKRDRPAAWEGMPPLAN